MKNNKIYVEIPLKCDKFWKHEMTKDNFNDKPKLKMTKVSKSSNFSQVPLGPDRLAQVFWTDFFNSNVSRKGWGQSCFTLESPFGT